MTKDVQYTYPKGNPLHFPDITCLQGEDLLIRGASGCGKTTLLHLIAGLITPQNGSIYINSRDITQLKSRELDSLRGREIGLVFQTPHFIKSLTAEENLMLPLSLTHQRVDQTYLEGLLETLGLTRCRKSKTNEMSQGELQRLSIARAVINKPSLILADEPTSSLDDQNCKEAISLLRSQSEKLQASLVIVTHDNRLISDFSRIIHLEPLQK